MSQARTYVVEGDPAWMPPQLRGRGEDRAVAFRFSRPERQVYRKARKIPVSQWAEQHIQIPMANLRGRWKNETLPYLAGIMDASYFPSVQKIIICAAPQTGKSECINVCLGYAVDRAPGPALVVYPDELTAKENSRDRILPMIKQSPQLRSYLTGMTDDEASMRIGLVNMPVYMAWAHSASRLANKPIRYLIIDECDKYPDTANKREGGPVDLAEKRTRTYRDERKIWMTSSPSVESGLIWVALTTEAQVVFDYEACCPGCGVRHVMAFEHIKWPEDVRDPELVEAKRLARYECPACAARWTDTERNAAVRWGRWVARGDGRELWEYLGAERPRKIGFHIPSWISRFVSLSEVAAAFLRGLKDKNKLKDFKNSHAAEPWKDYTVERKEDRILALRDSRPRGLVPGGGLVSCITAGVDTQDHGVWFEIRAWGWGRDLESWQIREGFLDTFAALTRVLFEDAYADPDGVEHPIRLVVQDAMGHRTSEVYDYARSRRGVLLPFKGEQRMIKPWVKTDLAHYPGKRRRIVGGLQLLRADTNFYKNILAGKLEVAPADPGAWHYHAETNEEWARHMCAEFINDKGFWECPVNRPNHGWDCSVLNLVAADVLGVKYWRKPGEQGQRAEGRGRRAEVKEKRRRW